MLRRRSSLFAGFGLVTVFTTVFTIVSCGGGTDDGGDTNTNGGAKSSGGSGPGGTAGKASAGTATGGSAGAPSVGGGGGSGGGQHCVPVKVTDAAILDFETGTVDATNPNNFAWGKMGSFNGGTYVYPTAQLKSTFSKTWNVAGNIDNYAGIGIWTMCQGDASAFKGVQFQISGDVGSADSVSFVMRMTSTDVFDMVNPSNASCQGMVGSTCVSPRVTVPVTSTPTTHKFTWEELTGGKPTAKGDPTQILGFQWEIPCIMPGTGGSGGGTSGGSGGASGGSGGASGGSGGTSGGSGGASGGTSGGSGGTSAGSGGTSGTAPMDGGEGGMLGEGGEGPGTAGTSGGGGASAGSSGGPSAGAGGTGMPPVCTPLMVNITLDNIAFFNEATGAGGASGGSGGASGGSGGATGGSSGAAGAGGSAGSAGTAGSQAGTGGRGAGGSSGGSGGASAGSGGSGGATAGTGGAAAGTGGS